jgi:uncharacterized protein YwgA
MDPYDFVHLALLAVGGEIRGKTKLQKTVYFLGVISGHLEELGYHFYGPYSEEVADAVDRLVAVGFVDREIRGGSGVDEFGFEVYRYDHRLNPDGAAVAKTKAAQWPEFWQTLKHAAEGLKKAPHVDYMKLSIAAKTYFMLGEKKAPATMTELSDLAKRFGWSVTANQVRDAANYLSTLGLVDLTQS